MVPSSYVATSKRRADGARSQKIVANADEQAAGIGRVIEIIVDEGRESRKRRITSIERIDQPGRDGPARERPSPLQIDGQVAGQAAERIGEIAAVTAVAHIGGGQAVGAEAAV